MSEEKSWQFELEEYINQGEPGQNLPLTFGRYTRSVKAIPERQRCSCYD
jgi:hypothetical protein